MNTEKTSIGNESQPSFLGAVRRSIYSYAVTGTFHGSIIEAETEGEARRIFHEHYNGESITHIKKRNVPAWCF